MFIGQPNLHPNMLQFIAEVVLDQGGSDPEIEEMCRDVAKMVERIPTVTAAISLMSYDEICAYAYGDDEEQDAVMRKYKIKPEENGRLNEAMGFGDPMH